MFFKSIKVFSVAAIFVFAGLSAFSQGVKEDIQTGKVPLPSDARTLQVPLPKMGNISTGTAYYKTSLSKRALLSFYAKELARRGWRDKENALQALNKLNAPFKKDHKGVNVEGLLKNMVYFHKGRKTLMLMLVPPRGRHTDTIFTLSYIGAGLYNQQNSQPQAGSLPSSVPVYPEAQFISQALRSRIYSVNNKGIDEVMDFYRQRMPSSGWILQNEVPISEEPLDTSRIFGGNTACESCPKPESIPPQVAAELKKGVSILKSELYFTNRSGASCKISFNQMRSLALPPRTQITIIYEE